VGRCFGGLFPEWRKGKKEWETRNGTPDAVLGKTREVIEGGEFVKVSDNQEEEGEDIHRKQN